VKKTVMLVIKKLLAWISLLVAFFGWVYVVAWPALEKANSPELWPAVLLSLALTIATTLLSPRSRVYDVVRYCLLAALAVLSYMFGWQDGVLAGKIEFFACIAACVLVTPSVIKDFRSQKKHKVKVDKALWASIVIAQPSRTDPESIPIEKLRSATDYLLPQLRRIIMESIEIIQRTRNDETRQGRIALCEKHITNMRKIAPFCTDSQLAIIRECEEAMKKIGH